MAIAFAQVKYLSRSKALQATAAAAYRSCSKIYDERTGLTFDYTKKQSPLLYSEIILPENADLKFKDREYLWNKAEHAETRTNSQVAKEIILALPKDDSISKNDKIELARRFAINHFVNKGVAVDINIHNEEGNPHAHILITTRRIIGNQFDSHKARDLDPKVIRGQVQADRIWGDEWRHFQNNYFLAQGLDLVVDADGIVSQIHLGKHVSHSKDKDELDLWQANETYKNEAKLIALTDPESVLNQLTLHHAVFTEHDIARLLHKHIDDPQEFQSTLIKVKASEQLISLGSDDNGKERFTTRAMFELENKLQDLAQKLDKQHWYPVNNKIIHAAIHRYQLNPEQANAIHHISANKNLSIIVGRAGTGKTYTLKAAKEIFERSGYNVQGIALSGIAVQGLKESAGISSRTIASFTHAIRKGTLELNNQDIIILDEAGMVDNYSLAEIVETIHKAKAKLVLVGDHDQLQPIGPGAPFRALLEQVGFAELNTIIRQEQEWQRQATHHFATANVKEAINAYHEKGHIHFSEPTQNATQQLIEDWHAKYTKEGLNLNQVIILAHRNSDVAQLNQITRAKRILAGEITQGVSIQKENEAFYLSQGDRLLFLKNDHTLSVKNGQFGTVLQINQNEVGVPKQIVVKLDNGKTVDFDPQKYCHYHYGYSATVHKTQGTTVDHSFIYVSGKFWNRNLLYVAASRHRKSMDLYVDQTSYSTLAALIQGIEKEGLKDSVLDYPLNFAKRRGLENEGLYERVKKYLRERLITMRDYLYEKSRHLVPDQRKEDLIDTPLKNNVQGLGTKQSRQSTDEIKLVTTQLEKLITTLEQAKKERDYIQAYKAKRALQEEIKRISRNKKIYQEVKSKSAQLGMKLGRYLESEYEI